jgi:hypothetical protein
VVDVTDYILPGTNTATFSLKNWGTVYGNTSVVLNVTGCTFNGSQGCSPGYWKNHLLSWQSTDYSNSQYVKSVFSAAVGYDTVSLLDALKLKGGSGVDGAVRILVRAAVASLLNSTSTGVASPVWATQSILDVNQAITNGDRDAILALADNLDLNNNLICPMN